MRLALPISGLLLLSGWLPAQTPPQTRVYYGLPLAKGADPFTRPGLPPGVSLTPPPGAAIDGGQPGIPPTAQSGSRWRWSWTAATGSGESIATLSPDGTVTSESQGHVEKGTWIRKGDEIWIDFGLGSRMGDHYLYKLRVSPDGSSMTLVTGNYYVRALTAVSLGSGISPGAPAASSAASSIDLAGTWRSNARDLGVSTWRFEPLGGGRYRAVNEGLGSATGTATLTGNRARVEWQTADRWTGYIDLTVDASGTQANGTTYVTSSPFGSRIQQDTAMSRASAPPPPAPVYVPPAPVYTPPAPVAAPPAPVYTTPAPAITAAGSDITGSWSANITGLGNSTWTFRPLGDGSGRYNATEQGLSNASGTAVVFNGRVRIDWKTPDRYEGF